MIDRKRARGTTPVTQHRPRISHVGCDQSGKIVREAIVLGMQFGRVKGTETDRRTDFRG